MNKKLKQVLTGICIMLLTVACGGGEQSKGSLASKADSVLFDLGSEKKYDQILQLADSFELMGELTALNANRWRGVAYYHQKQYQLAEVCYRKAVECKVQTEQDQLNYNKCARRLSELLLVKGDFEGSLQVAIPAVAKMDETGIGSDIDYAILLNNIGCCQLNLGRDKEANESFLTAREHYANRWQSDPTGRGFQEAVIGTVYTSMAYINMRRYAESIYWIDRTEMLLGKYMQKPDARTEYFDEYQGRIEIMRAVAQQGLGKTAEAQKAYEAFLTTDYSKTGAGRINANDYLVAAQRYGEAAYNYRFLDQALGEWAMELSLDNIQLYMLPKYTANAKAGQRDSAEVIGRRILSLLDSAITDYKNSSTAELATIYNTNQKEAQIARQQNDLSRQRFIGTLVALGLITFFLSIFTYFRIRSARRLKHAHQRLEDAHQRLEDAHAKLQGAYDKLEETTTAKERIESELRIARDIQMSMVPNVFPDRKGVDIFAHIAPAREVGGDLYGYLMQGDELYFCLGDVSGKGVPASLFMAQAIRLFRVLASQHMKPSDIATKTNNALTEDNEQGMFVTMFIGLVNLSTGKMDFCNAGHNPPLICDEDGKAVYLPMESNAPIGLWPDLDFVGESYPDVRNRTLLVYSDGLTEAENRSQEQFGEERVLTIVSNNHAATSHQIIDTLAAEVERHRDGADPNDDLTMMCLRINCNASA